MPFGATIVPEGARFRLWAPAARSVDLGLGADARASTWHALAGEADGWYHGVVAGADARTRRYRFAAVVGGMAARERPQRAGTMTGDDLARACAARGVDASYVDVFGQRHDAPDATLRAILHAMGADDRPAASQVPSARQAIPRTARCFQGEGRTRAERLFGPAVQLYALRSRRNWGIGDFTDLGALNDLAAAQGADLVGVNPLHALLPGETSPYSPSNRTALNALYLDVEGIEDFRECDVARARVLSQPFQARLERQRALPLVDYAEVSVLKFDLLKMLYAHFRERHMHVPTARARSFREFQRRCGETVRAAALGE